MDGNSVRGGLRSPLSVSAGSTRHRTYRLWRPDAVCSAIVGNALDPLERPDQLQKSSALLGSHGSRLRDVAVYADFVDLFRSFSEARGAEPICRRCGSVPARRSDDGGPGGAAAY